LVSDAVSWEVLFEQQWRHGVRSCLLASVTSVTPLLEEAHALATAVGSPEIAAARRVVAAVSGSVITNA